MLKFSIIVPIYNGEKYIRSTIENLLSSDYESLEVILVIDGSTDSSKKICDEFNENLRVKIIEKENGGIFSARNAGLYEATGEYVMFCDQDDILDVSILEDLQKIIKGNNNPNVICLNAKTFYDDVNESEQFLQVKTENQLILNQLQIREHLLYQIIYELRDRAKELLIENYNGQIWNCVYNRKFLQDNNIYFERCPNFEDDFLFSITCFAYATSVVLINRELYYWRLHQQSTSHTSKYIEDFYEKSMNVYRAEERVLNIVDIPENVRQNVLRRMKWWWIRKTCENELGDLNKNPINIQMSHLKQINLNGTRFKFAYGNKNKILWIFLKLKLYYLVKFSYNSLLKY